MSCYFKVEMMNLVKGMLEKFDKKDDKKGGVFDVGVWVMNIISFVGIIMVNK